MKTNLQKTKKYVSKFYCCPLCQFMERDDKQKVICHLVSEHTEEEAEIFIRQMTGSNDDFPIADKEDENRQ